MILPVTQGLDQLTAIVDIIKNADMYADRIKHLEEVHKQINDTYEIVMTLDEAKEVRAQAAKDIADAEARINTAQQTATALEAKAQEAFYQRELDVRKAEQALEASRNAFNAECAAIRKELNTALANAKNAEANAAQMYASLQIQSEEYNLRMIELNEKIAKIDSVMKAVA